MIEITLSPVIATPWLWSLAALGALATLVGLALRARGAVLRGLALILLWGALANPTIVQEDRTALNDVALVIVDESASQNLDDRAAQTEQVTGELLTALDQFEHLDVRVVRTGSTWPLSQGTRLMETLNTALSGVPAGQIGASFLITDGVVHDMPEDAALDVLPGPVHSLLTGRDDERDLRLTVEQAPEYMLVGDTAEVTVRVTGAGGYAAGTPVPVTLRTSGRPAQDVMAPLGEPVKLRLPVTRGSANVFELSVPAAEAELTPNNNRTALTIQGVRDRLKVLLISGEPHVGERAWRNLLKSDPNVDLVHFTILRPLTKDDGTPLNELALISFPIRELFEEQLYDFDLVIFDRYSRRGLVPAQFMVNIARYVDDGGAILLAVGPEYADLYTLYDSPLRSVLPGAPTGVVQTQPFRPRLTDIGRKHPVTASLDVYTDADGDPTWGRWMRQIGVIDGRGTNVMAGPSQSPLLVLDRVGEGRVALLLSDTVWLWGKGFDGGGPQAELMRRLGHWLMKEPELEEEWLSVSAGADDLAVTRRTLSRTQAAVTVSAPDGSEQVLSLSETRPGRLTGQLNGLEPGVYTVRDGAYSAVAAVGGANPLELQDVVSTSDRLNPLTTATGGAVVQTAGRGLPALRRVDPDRPASGSGWLGIQRNEAYTVDRVRQLPLLPLGVLALLLLSGLTAAWWREGR